MKDTSFKGLSKSNCVKIGNQTSSGKTNFRHMPHEFRNDMIQEEYWLKSRKEEKVL